MRRIDWVVAGVGNLSADELGRRLWVWQVSVQPLWPLPVSYLAPQRGLFTSPVGFLSHYSIKHQLDARLPTVQSSLPVTSLLTPLIPLHVRPARPHASPAHRLLVCTLVLSVLTFLIMEPPGGNLFPIADSDLSITCEVPPPSFLLSIPLWKALVSPVARLPSPYSSRASLKRLWKGNFWSLTAAQFSPLSVRASPFWNVNLLLNRAPRKTARWSISSDNLGRHGCRINKRKRSNHHYVEKLLLEGVPFGAAGTGSSERRIARSPQHTRDFNDWVVETAVKPWSAAAAGFPPLCLTHWC